MASLGARPRVDPDGQLRCELCPIRLSRAKGKLYKYGAGRICHACYDKQQRPAAADAPVAAAPASATPRKRRAESDPGELRQRTPSPRRTRPATQRVTLPEPASVQTQRRMTRQEERIMRLLDETHARRMAAQQQQQQR